MQVTKEAGVWLRRGEPGFDTAVLATSFNARDPGRRPEWLVQANDVFDVMRAVNFAREEGLKVGMCSGGHSWAQNHIREGGLTLDLSRLRRMQIDAAKRTALVEPACLGGELNDALARHGLFFPVAHAYTVGIGGFLLQGGFGWNSRVLGLACESVVGLDLVLADGSLVHASADENADLFWAARGAGTGFFAVVVRFHLRLHAQPKVVGLKLQVFRIAHLEEVFAWADRVGPTVSPCVEFQMVMNRRALGIFSHGIEVLAPVMADSWVQAREAVGFISQSPLRPKASLTLPLLPFSMKLMMKTGEKSLFLPHTRWTADNMWMDGPIGPLLPTLREIAATQPPAPSHALWLNWNPPAQREDMAFSMEARTYLALYGGLRHGDSDARHGDWATTHMCALQAHSKGIQLADENMAVRPGRFASEAHMQRLAHIRAVRDPHGVFNTWMGHA